MRSTVQEQTRLALEVTPGTAVAPTKRLLGLSLDLQMAGEFDEIMPTGLIVPTGQPMRQEWSTFSIEDGSYPDFNSVIYPLAGAIGAPVTTTPGGATLAREHKFTLSSTGNNTVQTFTIRRGTVESAEQANYGLFTGVNLGFTRTARPTIGGDGIARNIDENQTIGTNEVNVVTISGGPTGGTFTITVGGQTTSGIAYNAAASVVQTALEALSNVAPGDVTVTGSAGGPYTLAWAATFADTNVTISSSGASLTGGTAPAATTTTTQQGGPTEIDVKAILAGQGNIYLDDTAAGLGVSKMLGEYAVDASISGRFEPDWVINSALASFKGHVLARPDHSVKLTLANDATSRAFIAGVRVGTRKFLRAEYIGPDIESGQPHLFRLDAAIDFNAVPSRGAQGSASTLEYGARLAHDSTWGKALEVTVRNGLTGL